MSTSARSEAEPVERSARSRGTRTERPPRCRAAWAARRLGLQNVDMVAEEAIQADIGREVGVSRPTALEWHRKGSGDGEKV